MCKIFSVLFDLLRKRGAPCVLKIIEDVRGEGKQSTQKYTIKNKQKTMFNGKKILTFIKNSFKRCLREELVDLSQDV